MTEWVIRVSGHGPEGMVLIPTKPYVRGDSTTLGELHEILRKIEGAAQLILEEAEGGNGKIPTLFVVPSEEETDD